MRTKGVTLAAIETTRLTLPHPVRDGARAYKAVLDGQTVGKLRMGDMLKLDVQPGEHSLCIKIDFKKSNSIFFDLGQDSVKRFTCEPGGPYLMAIFDLFKAEGYVRLTRA